MPSLKIHRKYGELLGIDENIQKEIDRFIDDAKHHDFYDNFIEKSEFRFIYTKLIINNFNFQAFTKSKYIKNIEKYGYDGFRCFFLHIFLDYIERHLRAKRYIDFRNPIRFLIDYNEFEDFLDGIDKRDRLGLLIGVPRIVCLIMNISGELYRRSFEDVRSFIYQNYHKIAEDIKNEQDLKGVTMKVQKNLKKAQEIARLKNKARFSLFVGMLGSMYYYGRRWCTFPFYYRMVVKDDGVEGLIRELKRHGHYDIFIRNILENFEKFNDKTLFPELSDIIEKYSAYEIINDENLLKDFLKRIFKSK